MTIIDWILLALIILAVFVIALLFVRKWKKLLLIDLEAMPLAKLRQRKYQILEERFGRKTSAARMSVQRVIGPLQNTITGVSKKAYDKLIALERKYRHQSVKELSQEDKEKMRQKIGSMLETGSKHFKEGNLGEAEQTFMDIIRLNPKEVEAYEYLGEVFLTKKEYKHAIETLEFAKSLNPNEDRIYYDLGMVYHESGDPERALEYLQKAVELAPKSPRNLDGLLNQAIEMKDRFVAKETLRQLKEANPENQKLEELEQKVKEL